MHDLLSSGLLTKEDTRAVSHPLHVCRVQVCSLERSSRWHPGILQPLPPSTHLQDVIIACCASSSEEPETCLSLVNNCEIPHPCWES